MTIKKSISSAVMLGYFGTFNSSQANPYCRFTAFTALSAEGATVVDISV